MDLDKDRIKEGNYILYALPACIVFVLIYVFRGPVFEDDAYIFYRYAANWVTGYGPVFNINEYVEGYSSLLWTAILAIGAFSTFELHKLAPILNLFIGIFCLFLISRISTFITFSRPRLMAIILPLICALSYGFYYFGASGMDTLLTSLVLLLCIWSLYKSKITGNYLPALISLFLLNIVRAEGPLYSIVLLAIFAYFLYKEQNSFSRKLLSVITLFAVLTALLFFVRYSIYKAWIPATVLSKGYATHLLKTVFFSGDYQTLKELITVILSGIKYEEFLFYTGAWVPFVVLLWRKDKNNFILWLIAGAILTNIFVSVWAGGDYFPYKRQFIPVLPLLIIFVFWAIDLLLSRHWKGVMYKKVALSLIVILMMIGWTATFIKPPKATKRFFTGSERTELIREMGTLLHDVPEPIIMLSSMIGEVSYYAGPHVYVRDVFGLTDIHNAKFGDTWSFIWGEGVCGRIDFNYSYGTPFDIYFNNSPNLHKIFISYCQKNPLICEKYRFFTKEEWPKSFFYIVADVNHPVSKRLEEKFNAVALPVNEKLLDIMTND